MYKKMWIIMCLLSLVACKEVEPPQSLDLQVFAFNTLVSLQVLDHASPALEAEILGLLDQLEGDLSRYIDDSQVASINTHAGLEPVKVSETTLEILETCLYYSDLTQGAFDITIGPIIDLWDVGGLEPKRPENLVIEEALALVDYKAISIESGRVFLEKDKMSIDLGGVVKGYAADRLVDILKAHKVERAVINLGGNIYVHGTKADDVAWTVGIRNPKEGREDYMATLKLIDKTIVTSGPYEKYFVEEGVRYHHIFDTKTGYPTDNDKVSVTVIGDSSMVADLLTTALFALSTDEGLEIIENLQGYECLVIKSDDTLLLSSGLRNVLEITNDAFKTID